MRRSLVVGALAATFVGLAGPAYADDPKPEEVPLGEWEPFPDEYYEMVTEIEACGGHTFTITAGDERGAATRTTEYEDRIRIDYRGPETIDIERDDGTLLDELDVGGKGRTVIKPGVVDGLDKIREKLFGASLLLPFSPEESDQLVEEFGTDFVYWTDPDDYIMYKLVVDPETGEVVEVLETEVEADWIDLCKEFDELAEH